MHKDRSVGIMGSGGSWRSDLLSGATDRKRINEVLDKHLKKTSPSLTSKDNLSTSTAKSETDSKEGSDVSGSEGGDDDDTSWILFMFVMLCYVMSEGSDKYKNYDFGRCPRVFCCGQPCLPVGQSDIPRSSTVKIYCSKCEDVYYPRSKYQCNIDGAYFGATFPHLFLMAYGNLKPKKPTQSYVPKIFGFKVHNKQ